MDSFPWNSYPYLNIANGRDSYHIGPILYNALLYLIYSLEQQDVQKNMCMNTTSYGHSRGVQSPWHLCFVYALIHNYEVRHLALCNKHKKKFSSIPCEKPVLQNIFILTYTSVLLCAQREKNKTKHCLNGYMIPPQNMLQLSC